MYKIGVIGSGNRLTPLVLKLAENEDFQIRAICDTNYKEIKEKYKELDIHYYNSATKMLECEHLDCLMIGTRCSSHTKFMELAAQYKLPTFLEKPVCINDEQLSKLEKIDNMDNRVVVSFPLRNSPIVNKVREIIQSGAIGKIAHVQAYNNVNYGRGYYHKWYRDDKETGGLWLQKATHDFDYINSLLDVKPTLICAMDSKQVFKGNLPEGLKCTECNHRKECPESDINVKSYNDTFIIGEYCCFAKDTGNEDSGSALVLYENGMHVVYTQNFIVRKGAGKRGARLIGYYGTIEFDFNSGEIKVYYHNTGIVEKHIFPNNSGHSGGDDQLIKNFAAVVRGEEISHSPLSDGILSAKMCLLAKKSAIEKNFCEIR